MDQTYRAIMCGGRDEGALLMGAARAVIVGLAERHRSGPRLVIVHGAARGMDRACGDIARSLGLWVEEHPADWAANPHGAGHIRNQLMLDTGVREVWAFKSTFDWTMTRGGTEDMVRRARKALVPAYVVQGPVE